jgi:hypothetical protein
MGLAVMSLSPVAGALILYLIYYRLPAILSINSPTYCILHGMVPKDGIMG